MTENYLVGELSVLLAGLQDIADDSEGLAGDFGWLRHLAEDGPMSGLPSVTRRGLGLADELCWYLLLHDDMAGFLRCADTAAGLYEFGVCACLVDPGTKSEGT